MKHHPFAPAAEISEELGVYDDAVLRRRGFLYRVITFAKPSDESGGNLDRSSQPLELIYNGWWFLQRVYLNDQLVWWAISWTSLKSHINVDLSRTIDPGEASFLPNHLRIEIGFSRGLVIRRFRVWLDHQIRYDEVS